MKCGSIEMLIANPYFRTVDFNSRVLHLLFFFFFFHINKNRRSRNLELSSVCAVVDQMLG